MYSNLINEMKKLNITQFQLASLLDVRAATISDKLNGKSKFYFNEAIKIKKTFFPHLEIEYLFSFDN